ncbi:conserved unknown protein [Ectocarpus siliculosus]|uniref:Uncharacterized protein n=1 Tax=Ectocarpus siliculosus TaxID=2880 RepID=D7FLG2_ECTSI|nr:conserved unknown protein [Ectocarpus siliculosus]|eukprot:CBJ34231.1 conserved unknown protein [Ectocarpus siliculosus]
MKRGLLYACCREQGYNKLVLAQHLDDLAESFIMSALHNGQGPVCHLVLLLRLGREGLRRDGHVGRFVCLLVGGKTKSIWVAL